MIVTKLHVKNMVLCHPIKINFNSMPSNSGWVLRIAMAMIYSYWKNPETGKNVQSSTIVTTEANELMAEIHNTKKRMPVLLREADRTKWLSGTDYHDFEFTYEVDLVAKAC